MSKKDCLTKYKVSSLLSVLHHYTFGAGNTFATKFYAKFKLTHFKAAELSGRHVKWQNKFAQMQMRYIYIYTLCVFVNLV